MGHRLTNPHSNHDFSPFPANLTTSTSHIQQGTTDIIPMECLNFIIPNESGPMVMIHKGWKVSPKYGVKATTTPVLQDEAAGGKTERSGKNVGRKFEFVQESKPIRYRDPVLGRQVRSHVRKETVRAEKEREKASSSSSKEPEHKGKPSSKPRKEPHDTGQNSIGALAIRFGDPTALISYQYPITMTAHTHELLSQYLTTASKGMFPLKTLTSNPLMSPEWFRFAVADEAMLHAVLYSASVYLALLQGQKESKDTIYHQSQILSILRKRLMFPDSGKEKEESTIGAISCLALGEAVAGNRERWAMHMRGIKELVSVRGGMQSLRPLMQAKLCRKVRPPHHIPSTNRHRSDITGAIDYIAMPLLTFERPSNSPRVWESIPAEQLKNAEAIITETLGRCFIHPTLRDAMVEVAYFSLTVQDPRIAVEPTSFSEDMYRIEYNLLSLSPEGSMISEVCRVGGLLYMKALLQEWPHSSAGPSILLSQLHTSLNLITIAESKLPLLLWVGLLGGLMSQGEQRTYFVIYMASLGTSIPFPERGDEMCSLGRLLDLRNVFGGAVDELWRDVSWVQTPL